MTSGTAGERNNGMANWAEVTFTARVIRPRAGGPCVDGPDQQYKVIVPDDPCNSNVYAKAWAKVEDYRDAYMAADGTFNVLRYATPD